MQNLAGYKAGDPSMQISPKARKSSDLYINGVSLRTASGNPSSLSALWSVSIHVLQNYRTRTPISFSKFSSSCYALYLYAGVSTQADSDGGAGWLVLREEL